MIDFIFIIIAFLIVVIISVLIIKFILIPLYLPNSFPKKENVNYLDKRELEYIGLQ